MSHGRFKTNELLERANMKYRDCMSPEDIIEKLEQKIDYTQVNKWLENERKKAKDYLRNAIEG